VRLHGHHAQHDRLDHNQRLLYVVLGPRQLRTGGDCPRGQQPIQLLLQRLDFIRRQLAGASLFPLQILPRQHERALDIGGHYGRVR